MAWGGYSGWGEILIINTDNINAFLLSLNPKYITGNDICGQLVDLKYFKSHLTKGNKINFILFSKKGDFKDMLS